MQIYIAMQVLAKFHVIFKALHTNELVFNRLQINYVAKQQLLLPLSSSQVRELV
mgnify:CR=1 FL=1